MNYSVLGVSLPVLYNVTHYSGSTCSAYRDDFLKRMNKLVSVRRTFDYNRELGFMRTSR